MKKTQKKKLESLIKIFKIAVPNVFLKSIRRCTANELRRKKIPMENASILVTNLDSESIFWLYQAPQEKARILVNKNFTSTVVVTGKTLVFDPPPNKYPDELLIEESPGYFATVVIPKQIRDFIEGGGLNGYLSRMSDLPQETEDEKQEVWEVRR